MKKLIFCFILTLLPFSSNATTECVNVSKMAGTILLARNKGMTKSEMINILRNEPIALEMVDQVFLMKLAEDDAHLMQEIDTYMNIWFEECVKLNSEFMAIY